MGLHFSSRVSERVRLRAADDIWECKVTDCKKTDLSNYTVIRRTKSTKVVSYLRQQANQTIYLSRGFMKGHLRCIVAKGDPLFGITEESSIEHYCQTIVFTAIPSF